MSDKKIFDQISSYYNQLIETYGHDPKACDYGHPASQTAKFNVLSQATSYSNKSILDVGCGFADFYEFLQNNYQNINYSGIDISEKMIAFAQQKYPNLNLSVGNVFQEIPEKNYDIITANGIFYLMGKDANSYLKLFIEKMFSKTNEVLAFNSLSRWAPDKEKDEFYADPIEIIEFCHTLTSWVTLRHDYHTRDFTIFMYKKQHQK